METTNLCLHRQLDALCLSGCFAAAADMLGCSDQGEGAEEAEALPHVEEYTVQPTPMPPHPWLVESEVRRAMQAMLVAAQAAELGLDASHEGADQP
jgi:hypothetical protein